MLAPWLFALENPMKERIDRASEDTEEIFAIESSASDLLSSLVSSSL